MGDAISNLPEDYAVEVPCVVDRALALPAHSTRQSVGGAVREFAAGALPGGGLVS
jgi:hypothetical protein